MKCVQCFGIAAGMLLLLSGVFANASALRLQPTEITLDISSLEVNLNETVTFTGTLVNSNTGEGLQGKSITIYMEGPIVPERIALGLTGIDGAFSTTWVTTLDMNRDRLVTVFAQFNGDAQAMASRTGKTTLRVALIPINLEITTDGNKNRYFVGKTAFFSVAFFDGMGNFLDPDVIKATYDSIFISLKREDLGRYTFQTPRLVTFAQHQFGVFAGGFGYTSAQESLTITVFGAEIAKPIRATALKIGDDISVRVKNHMLSPHDIYTFKGKFIGASPTTGSSTNWQFTIEAGTDSFAFKSLVKSLPPGKFTSFKVKVEGSPAKMLWKAFDLHGEEVAAGATTVRAKRA
ncbi:MAG: hypothetical protein ACE5J2_01820 [Nitrososphaerales archaeon]